MIYAFFESIKYVGHLFPVAVLRIYMGFWFLGLALDKYNGDYLLQPKLAAAINDFLPGSAAPEWYRNLMDSVVVPNWQIFAYSLMYFEFLIGISLIIGFLSRPVSLVMVLVSWSYLYMSPAELWPMHKLIMVVGFVLAWLGAGRCLGLDYFFFKRQRGLLW